MNMKFFLLLSCAGLILTICSCTKSIVGTDQLLVLDSQKLGSNNMKILIKETEFSNNISTIENKVYKRGSAAGSSMFVMCSFILFAKKRGYSHVVILDSSSNYNCDDCEWESTMEVGYLKDVNPTYVNVPGMQFKNMDDSKKVEVGKFLKEQFPQHDLSLRSDKLDIYPVKSFMLVCKKLENICSW